MLHKLLKNHVLKRLESEAQRYMNNVVTPSAKVLGFKEVTPEFMAGYFVGFLHGVHNEKTAQESEGMLGFLERTACANVEAVLDYIARGYEERKEWVITKDEA